MGGGGARGVKCEMRCGEWLLGALIDGCGTLFECLFSHRCSRVFVRSRQNCVFIGLKLVPRRLPNRVVKALGLDT